MDKTIGEMKLETQQILKLLLKLGDDEILTYEEIQSKVGVDVQDGQRGLLATAIKNAEKETNRLFGTVRTVGVKRLPPGHSSGELTKARERARHIARRAFGRSRHVDFTKLTPDERNTLNMERTVLHFVAESASDKAVRRLTAAVDSAGDALTFAKTLEHFGK